jgi:uncharacterized protein YbjT (DUF2867 family)
MTMSKVLILGANGGLARNTTRAFLEGSDATLTLNLRRASRLKNPEPKRATIMEGDVRDHDVLLDAMNGQYVVYANLAGEMAPQAHAIVDAMHTVGLKGLIFTSLMGIDGESLGTDIVAS